MPGSLEPYCIGSPVWPGLVKLIEESGEVAQIVGKLMAFPGGAHPDGQGPLRERLEDELADLRAILEYVVAKNNLDRTRMDDRTRMKIDRFLGWHNAEPRREAA